jgi:hypothetical protein
MNMMIMSLLIGAIAAMNSATTPMTNDSTPIAVEETGFAREYEASKKIVCGSVEWKIDWKSGAELGDISGSARVLIAGKDMPLPDIQKNILDKFATIDDVSATCNKGADGKSVRTALMITGNELKTGKKSLAQVRVGPGSEVQWTFDTA